MKKITLSILTVACMIAHAAHDQFITSINKDGQRITFVVNKQFHTAYLRDNLFVEYDTDIDLNQLDYTIITMPLIMNTIAIIWISGNDYYIDAMDRDLYYSLEIVRKIFKRFYPSTAFNGNLIPKQLINNRTKRSNSSKTTGIALPFSHGLDSLCTSLRLRETPQLLITARGMPDTPLNSWDTNWDYTKNSITHFAQLYGHTTTFITSNFHEFFNWRYLCNFSEEIQHWRLCVVEGLGWMGLAAPILVTKGYTTFVLPANGDWYSPHPGADCPLINSNVTFAGIYNISDGFEIPRMAKNQIIADICNKHDLEKPTFIICEEILDNRKNCCTCQKCVSSILALLLLHEKPCDYGFDMPLPDFLNYFKTTFVTHNSYEPDTARAFKYYQQQAHTQLSQLSPELQQFFTWYVTLNFDAQTVLWNNIIIDYNNFIDIYPHVPQEILKLTQSTIS